MVFINRHSHVISMLSLIWYFLFSFIFWLEFYTVLSCNSALKLEKGVASAYVYCNKTIPGFRHNSNLGLTIVQGKIKVGHFTLLSLLLSFLLLVQMKSPLSISRFSREWETWRTFTILKDFKSIIEEKRIAYEMRSSDFIDIPNGMSNGKYASGKPLSEGC